MEFIKVGGWNMRPACGWNVKNTSILTEDFGECIFLIRIRVELTYV